MNNTSKQISKNMIWNGVSVLISTVISLTLTPYVTTHIGIEANGFINLANTCVSYIDIITIALNAFAARYIAIEYHNKRYKEANQFYNSVIIANLILMVLMDIPLFAMIWRLQNILNISDGLVFDVKVLFALVLVNYSIGIIGTAYTVVAFIKNMTSVTYRNTGISKLIYAVTIGGLIYFTGIRVYYMAIANLIAMIFNLLMNIYYTKNLIPELCFQPKKFSFVNVRKLLSSGIWNSINSIGNLLNSGLDLLVCNKLLNEVIMGQVSISKQLSVMMTTFTNIIVNAFQPKQLEAYSKGNIQQLTKYLCVSMKITGIAGNVFFACFAGLGLQFLKFWLPGQDISKIFILTLIVLVGDVVVVVVRPLYYIFTLTDKLKMVCWITICSGFMNVILMIVLIKTTSLGGYAVVGTTMVLNLVVQFWAAPHYGRKYLKLKKNIFIPVVIRHIYTCVFSTIFIVSISHWAVLKGWLDFMGYAIVYGIISLFIVSMFELNSSERKSVYGIIRKRIGHKKWWKL